MDNLPRPTEEEQNEEDLAALAQIIVVCYLREQGRLEEAERVMTFPLFEFER